MSLYDRVRELPLEIDGYELEPLEHEVARGFTLRRTVVETAPAWSTALDLQASALAHAGA